MSKRLLLFLSILLLCEACTRRRPDESFSRLFYDDFDRADQLLSASVGWVVVQPGTSVLAINGNQVLPIHGGVTAPSAFYATSYTAEEVIARLDVSVAGGTVSAPYVLLLAQSDTSTLASSTSRYGCGFNGGAQLVLLKKNTPVATGSTVFDFTSGSSYLIVFSRLGNVVTCTVTGDESDNLGYSDSSPEIGGYFGITGGVPTLNYAYVDNFEVLAR